MAEDFKGPCLVFDKTKLLYTNAPEASVSFARSMSSKKAQESMGFAAGGRARFGVVSASASAEFASQTAADDYSETTTYQAKYLFKNVTMNQVALAQFAEEKKGTGPFANDAFYETCGDEFLDEVRLGAALFINARIDFTTREARQRFASKFSVSGPAFGVSGELAKASTEFADSAMITMSAYQRGGRVDRLSTIMSAKVKNPTAVKYTMSDETYAIITCAISNLGPCGAFWDAALKYATDPKDPDAFPQQLAGGTADPTQPGGPADLSYITRPWTNLGVRQKPRIVDDILRQKRNELERRLDYWLSHKARIDALQVRILRLSPSQRDYVAKIARMIEVIFTEIGKAATTCYSDDTNCAAAVDQLGTTEAKERTEAGFHEELFEVRPETFAQWCDATDIFNLEAQPPPALRETWEAVGALVQYAKSVARPGIALDKETDKCGFIEKLLDQVEEIAVRDQPFRDLRPLLSLRQIKALSLVNVQLTRLAGLGQLTNLVSLRLGRNSISEVGELSALEKLLALDVSQNHISDVKPLTQLRRLRFLNLSENPLGSRQCPLVNSDAMCVF